MEYSLELHICTDGDFGFQFMPRDMQFDGEDYHLTKEYTNKDRAFDDTLSICQYLHDNVSGRDYTVEDFKHKMMNFINHIKDIRGETVDEFFVSESMSGNYDGTEFQFQGRPKFVNCGFRVTEEEWNIIKSGIDAGVTNQTIKEAVIALCKKQIQK